jgi:hypothetical protein
VLVYASNLNKFDVGTFSTKADQCDVMELYIYACNETNMMHYLSSIYWVTTPLHFSGLLASHQQEVADPAGSRLRRTSRTNYHIYTLLPPDNGLLASPKHVEMYWLSKAKINSASGWFHYTHISRSRSTKRKILCIYYVFIFMYLLVLMFVEFCVFETHIQTRRLASPTNGTRSTGWETQL